MIAIGCDHGGFSLKNVIIDFLKENNYEYNDFGTFDENSVDYPDIADKVCKAITDGYCNCGINKHKGIRAAQCSDTFSAKMTRQHNDANVLTLGGRVIGPELAKCIVNEFLTSSFLGGRHKIRVDKLMNVEKQ